MSRYLNPKDKPKEVWLMDNGLVMLNPFQLSDMNGKSVKENTIETLDLLAKGVSLEFNVEDGHKELFERYAIVDLINNGKFRAAAVLTSHEECIEHVKECEDDLRQHLWFIVKKDKALAEVRPFPSN